MSLCPYKAALPVQRLRMEHRAETKKFTLSREQVQENKILLVVAIQCVFYNTK